MYAILRAVVIIFTRCRNSAQEQKCPGGFPIATIHHPYGMLRHRLPSCIYILDRVGLYWAHHDVAGTCQGRFESSRT